MGKRIIAGNWKMNPISLKEAVELARGVEGLLKDLNQLERIIFPPFVYLYPIKLEVKNVELGAQDVFYEDKGAYTGEISPKMLKDIGINWVIVGHSERRHIIGEDNKTVIKKTKKALEEGFNVILCVGETLNERELYRHKEVVKRQLDGVPDSENLIIAYEPVWAIGTGRNAKPEQIEEMHTLIKDLTGKRVLYGGSVKPENSDELASVRNVDGFLVGGASLDSEKFHKIALSLISFQP
ncbi:MAG: triose-phosphate isomerase [candidate division WOR-3 bacterium]